jgi:hypothetical protein
MSTPSRACQMKVAPTPSCGAISFCVPCDGLSGSSDATAMVAHLVASPCLRFPCPPPDPRDANEQTGVSGPRFAPPAAAQIVSIHEPLLRIVCGLGLFLLVAMAREPGRGHEHACSKGELGGVVDDQPSAWLSRSACAAHAMRLISSAIWRPASGRVRWTAYPSWSLIRQARCW